jgi:hypothetical protein
MNMGSWGSELWDRYSCVLSHVTRGGDELSTVFAKFIKERGEVEKEYAKNVKKLVGKYQQKTQIKQGKETTQAMGFRWEICLKFSDLIYQSLHIAAK